jgi:hypothetical protein
VTLLPALPFRLHRNALKGCGGAPVLDTPGFVAARDAITAWPGYAATPLVDLPGLALARHDPTAAATLGLDASSRVLLFGTEGATDPELYARLVGAPA